MSGCVRLRLPQLLLLARLAPETRHAVRTPPLRLLPRRLRRPPPVKDARPVQQALQPEPLAQAPVRRPTAAAVPGQRDEVQKAAVEKVADAAVAALPPARRRRSSPCGSGPKKTSPTP